MRLLIGYDGSSSSDAAISDLQRAGLPSDVEALVVSIIDAPTIPPLASHKFIENAFVGERVLTIVEQANRHVLEALKQASELVQSICLLLESLFSAWQISGVVLAGAPASELVRIAEEWNADLIVVGSQRRSALGRVIFGSTSMEVIKRARCAVRIGRQATAQANGERLRILLSLDGSPGGEQAVRKVLMRTWPVGTELRLIVVDSDASPILPDVASIPVEHVRAESSIAASRMIKLALTRGLTVSAELIRGDPQRSLIAEARVWKAHCIVIGSRATRSTVYGLLVRSLSVGLVANAKCSVEIAR